MMIIFIILPTSKLFFHIWKIKNLKRKHFFYWEIHYVNDFPNLVVITNIFNILDMEYGWSVKSVVNILGQVDLY